MKKSAILLNMLLYCCLTQVFAQDLSNSTVRREGDTLSTDTKCAILVAIPANNINEYNLKVTYLDSRLRLFNEYYAGYTASSITNNQYKVSIDFDQSCDKVLTDIVSRDLFPK